MSFRSVALLSTPERQGQVQALQRRQGEILEGIRATDDGHVGDGLRKVIFCLGGQVVGAGR